MTTLPTGSPSSAPVAMPGVPERRRAPRIAPLSADVYAGGARTVRESSLPELKARSRKPGEASFFYLDHHFQHNAVKVLPGEYFVADENMIIMTVLGSCIAACLWDSRALVGGMNHFMLPDGDVADASGRYGSYAMELLINEMLKLGARRETMQAKIFGGAQVMHNFTTMNVGERNTNFVLNYLHTERIPIVSEDVLDIYPRKVVFFPVTGKAMVKRLAHAHPEALAAQEVRGNAAVVAKATSGGSVDLF
ncbi:MAG: chemoreceptor glutamine deamidase CheD [Acidovorax sp.]|uniref:chemoreceptor glutamine deamidase CheD n=1 Tax=Acidovorax sp. TaxID=1872122 RepID=UPI0025C6CE4D|nr:chemoreceptor glutamine deamidase CheD [Acidovorax sp.]MCE1194371.1 chemoreceptor glutamine deamidase CheD [Acidovorax sp.]